MVVVCWWTLISVGALSLSSFILITGFLFRYLQCHETRHLLATCLKNLYASRCPRTKDAREPNQTQQFEASPRWLASIWSLVPGNLKTPTLFVQKDGFHESSSHKMVYLVGDLIPIGDISALASGSFSQGHGCSEAQTLSKFQLHGRESGVSSDPL